VYKSGQKISWGFLEVILTYILTFILGLVYNKYSSPIMNTVHKLGIPDSDLANFTFSMVVQVLVTIILVLLFTIVFNQANMKDLGLKGVEFRTFIKYGILGGLILIAFIQLTGQFINLLHPELEPQMFETVLRSVVNPGEFLILLLLGAVLVPFAEELFYRGMIYPVFRKHIGPLWGALFAGSFFGLAHWDLWRMIPLTAGGFVLCYLYEKTGSIIIPTVAHGLWNGVMAIIVYTSIFIYN